MSNVNRVSLGMHLVNLLPVYIYLVQYRHPNKKHLLGVSFVFIFVGATPGHFPISSFLSTKGFESRSFGTYASNEYFLTDNGYSERVPPASNAPRCEVLAAETKITASSRQEPTT